MEGQSRLKISDKVIKLIKIEIRGKRIELGNEKA